MSVITELWETVNLYLVTFGAMLIRQTIVKICASYRKVSHIC